MLCVQCFTSWPDVEDYVEHLKAHARLNGGFSGESQARVKHALNSTVNARWRDHTLENCKCRYHKVALECELRIKDIR